MSVKYEVKVYGSAEIRADLKRLALVNTAEFISTNYNSVSINSMELYVTDTDLAYSGYYKVEYIFSFTLYADSDEKVMSLAKNDDTFVILKKD